MKVFVACLLGAGAASLALGKDVNWDLRNYHYYNAFALLNGRLGWDIAPAQIQTYLNPLADLPFYALVNTLPGPRWVAFAMAGSTGISAFFLLRMLALLFPADAPHRLLCILAAAVIGLTGASGVAVIGSTMNEWHCAAFLLAGLYFAIRSIVLGGQHPYRGFALSGLLVGCAFGLKLTYGAYGLGLIAACASFGTSRERTLRCVTAGVAMLAGFLAFYGFWGVILQREFGSPFFPFFNEFFKSPWWEIQNWFDTKFGPRNVLQAIAFPLWFARESSLVSEIAFRDYRLAVLLVLGIVVACAALLRRRRSSLAGSAPSHSWLFLAVFALVSYATWLAMFAIHRYLLPLEVLSGALIVAGLIYLFRGAGLRRTAILILALLLIGTTRKPGWERAPFDDKYLDVRAPALAPDSLVILGYNVPASYTIAFFRRDARFVSPESNFISLRQRNLLAREIADLIASHAGSIYLLEQRTPPPGHLEVLGHFRLEKKSQPCEVVKSNVDHDALHICRLLMNPR